MIEYICIGLIGLFAALLVWSFVPVWIVKRFSITDPKERADVEDNYRKTMGQAIGALALLVTFAWTFYKDRQSIGLSTEQFRTQTKQFKLQQDQARDQFTNQQFISAAGLLKEVSVSSRIAGLYAMEQIARVKPPEGAKNQYLIPVIRALVGFVKNPFNANGNVQSNANGDAQSIAADAQSAITILGHLNENQSTSIDLSGAKLTRGDFKSSAIKAFAASDFQGAILYGTDMSGLDLTGARFGGSSMADADAYGGWDKMPTGRLYDDTRWKFTVNFDNSTLADTNFDNAGMSGASLVKACLAGASFDATDLSRALFQGADMGGSPKCSSTRNKAYFYNAIFVDANFDDVDVDGISFVGSNITRANFLNAKNVEKAAFDHACADEPPKFPSSVSATFSKCVH
jgi:uncharacterized protein YjbI with pentapeptide repeats